MGSPAFGPDFYFSSTKKSFSRMRIEITVLTTPLMGLGEKIDSKKLNPVCKSHDRKVGGTTVDY